MDDQRKIFELKSSFSKILKFSKKISLDEGLKYVMIVLQNILSNSKSRTVILKLKKKVFPLCMTKMKK